MALLEKGIESLRPFGPPSSEQLRLMYSRVPDGEDHALAHTKIEQKMGFKRIHSLLDLWWASLRKTVHVSKSRTV
jgi:hypothetical protein